LFLLSFLLSGIQAAILNAIKLENISNLITSRLVINVGKQLKQSLFILLFMAGTHQWNVYAHFSSDFSQQLLMAEI
jgi:hypothetical protein